MSSEYPQPVSPYSIDPAHLVWLCRPERLEQTLCLLYALSVWQRSGKHLLYADRQGLREVQALILEQATRTGQVWATTYLESKQRFPAGLLLESAAQNAVRGVLLHLRILLRTGTIPPFLPEEIRLYQRYIRPLFRRVTGQNVRSVTEAASALRIGQVRAYIQDWLDTLIRNAGQTHLPLSTRRLAALCLAPIDLLPILYNRLSFLESYESWDDLDPNDRLRLDPEGESQIAFGYQNTSATLVFHLPLRRAETFVPAERMRALRLNPGTSWERGEIGCTPITEHECLARPPQEILQELGIDVSRVCPYELVDRQSYLARPDVRNLRWSLTGQDEEEWHDDPWDGLCLPPGDR